MKSLKLISFLSLFIAQASLAVGLDPLTKEFQALGTQTTDTLLANGINEVEGVSLKELRAHILGAKVYYVSDGSELKDDQGRTVDATNSPELNQVLFQPLPWSKANKAQRRFFVIHETLGLMRRDSKKYEVSSAIMTEYHLITGGDFTPPPAPLPTDDNTEYRRRQHQETIAEPAFRLVSYLAAKRAQGFVCDKGARLDAGQWNIFQLALRVLRPSMYMQIDPNMKRTLVTDPVIRKQMRSSLHYTMLVNDWKRPAFSQIRSALAGTVWRSFEDSLELADDGVVQFKRGGIAGEKGRWHATETGVVLRVGSRQVELTFVVSGSVPLPALVLRESAANAGSSGRAWSNLPDMCPNERLQELSEPSVSHLGVFAKCEGASERELSWMVMDLVAFASNGKGKAHFCRRYSDRDECHSAQEYDVEVVVPGVAKVSGSHILGSIAGPFPFSVIGVSGGSSLAATYKYGLVSEGVDNHFGYDGLRCELTPAGQTALESHR